MIFRTQSSIDALVFNGKPEHVVNPWEIIINTDEETIVVKKRNWHLIGKDEQLLAFRFIRNITIDQHMFGADIHIKIMGGKISAYSIPKKDAKTIREILNNYNQTKKGKSIIFS